MPKKPTTPATAHTHADKRPNIPTEEIRDFIAEDERKPKTVLYRRDPEVLAAEIIEDLKAALEQFEGIMAGLRKEE